MNLRDSKNGLSAKSYRFENFITHFMISDADHSKLNTANRFECGVESIVTKPWF